LLQIAKIKQISSHKPAKLCKKTKPKTIWEVNSSPSPRFPLSPTWEKRGEGLEFPILNRSLKEHLPPHVADAYTVFLLKMVTSSEVFECMGYIVQSPGLVL
jgi:hypothetical protein